VLSPLEEADLKKRRAQFKAVYSCFELNGIYDAEQQLSNLEVLVETSFHEQQNKLLVKNLNIKTNDDKEKMVIDIVKDLTVSEAVSYFRALLNAIDHHKFNKTKDIKVEDLEIKLL